MQNCGVRNAEGKMRNGMCGATVICGSIILLTGQLTFGTVYLATLFCLIQLIRLNLGLINLSNIKMLFMISEPKFMEPELLLDINISISSCILEYKMRS